MERKIIWPDTMNHPPDILLSIGTGHDAKLAALKIKNRRKHFRTRAHTKVELPQKGKTKKLIQLRYVSRLFQGMKNRADNMINSELAWQNFTLDVSKFHEDSYIETRYQRINPDLGSNPPPMDKVENIKEVQNKTRHELRNQEKSIQKIREISSRLVASSFYFEKSSKPENPGEKYIQGTLMVSGLVLRHQLIFTGTILCKFFSGELEIRNLGRYLRDRMRSSFGPHFIITENFRVPSEEKKIKISRDIISNMTEEASFRLADITINISGEDVMTNIDLSVVSGHRFPISGFPRALMEKPSPICKLILRYFSSHCSSTAYSIL